MPEITVTASPLGGSTSNIAIPSTVLAGEALRRQTQGSIGETVKDLPGVNSTFFGPAASRPVIRGFDGPRVRVLSDGGDVMDASSISPDHAVTVEPFLSKQIEVLKGPTAAILYGGGAIGGIVNVVDERIPTNVPARGYEGEAQLRGASNGWERLGVLGFTVGHGNLAFRIEGVGRRADDYDAARRQDGTGSRRVRNSSDESATIGLGSSWIGDSGHVGVSFGEQWRDYGIPGDEDVEIRMRSRRADVRGEVRMPISGIEKIRLHFGHVDYRHRELEEGDVATTFRNKGTDTRLEIVHEPIHGLRGAVGLQGLWRDFEALGEEAYIAPTVTRNYGIFLLEKLTWGDLQIEGGLRYEWQRIDVRSNQPDRRHDGVSGSLGFMWEFVPGYTVGFAVSRAQRLPTAEELYADGPHHATGRFEIGAASLKAETSRNIDLNLRKRTGAFQFDLGIYRNAVKDFVFAAETGEDMDGLPVVRYRQGNSVFYGFEAEARYAVTPNVTLALFGDYVRARLRAGDDLPRIPPGRIGTRMDAQWQGWQAYLQYYHVFAQRQVAPLETETGGYNMLNTGIAYGGDIGPLTSYQFFLRATNLLNQKALAHTSFIKEQAPLPGLSVLLGARMTF